MFNRVLLDSCFWVALFLSQDSNHQKAITYSEFIKISQLTPIVHNTILLEIFTVLKMRKYPKLKDLVSSFINSELAIIDDTPFVIEYDLLNVFLNFKDISIVDTFLLQLALAKGYSFVTFDSKLINVSKSLGVKLIEIED